MRFIALSKMPGTVGYAIHKHRIINTLQDYARYSSFWTPLKAVMDIKEEELNSEALEKFEEYKRKISQMDYPAAIRYTANFYKKGLRTFVPFKEA